jgi:heterodisulfide reductase subunit C
MTKNFFGLDKGVSYIIQKKMQIDLKDRFITKVEELSGQTISACYQCGRCSGGCPSASFMDLLPNQIMRLTQLGRTGDVLNCRTIWLCASCFTCVIRCPKGVDLARVMEAFRQILLRRNVDYLEPLKIEVKERVNLPQIALVSSFRKLTA